MNSKKERVIKIGSRVLFWIVLGAFLAFILLPMFWAVSYTHLTLPTIA